MLTNSRELAILLKLSKSVKQNILAKYCNRDRLKIFHTEVSVVQRTALFIVTFFFLQLTVTSPRFPDSRNVSMCLTLP